MERRMDRQTFVKTVPLFLGALVVAQAADRVIAGQTGQGDIDEQGTQRDAVDPELNRGRTNFYFLFKVKLTSRP